MMKTMRRVDPLATGLPGERRSNAVYYKFYLPMTAVVAPTIALLRVENSNKFHFRIANRERRIPNS